MLPTQSLPLLLIVQLLIGAFTAILFLQSGFDKVLHYNDNYQWLLEHFKKSVLRSSVWLLLPVITFLELLAGLLAAVGMVLLLWRQEPFFAIAAQVTAATALLGLFAGQRIAKDYAGAAALAPYFIVSVLGVLVYSIPKV